MLQGLQQEEVRLMKGLISNMFIHSNSNLVIIIVIECISFFIVQNRNVTCAAATDSYLGLHFLDSNMKFSA